MLVPTISVQQKGSEIKKKSSENYLVKSILWPEDQRSEIKSVSVQSWK